MKRSKLVILISVLILTFQLGPSVSTAESSGEVGWEQIIGIIQAGNVVGSGTGAVTGGGQPWSTTEGEAEVNLKNGDIAFEVRGLVLAGGNSIGTPDGITMVKGTLVCDTNGSAGGGNSTLVDTPAVPLSAQGDAEFSGNVGPLPAACNEPDIAFLIRISAGRWIANGAVRIP